MDLKYRNKFIENERGNSFQILEDLSYPISKTVGADGINLSIQFDRDTHIGGFLGDAQYSRFAYAGETIITFSGEKGELSFAEKTSCYTPNNFVMLYGEQALTNAREISKRIMPPIQATDKIFHSKVKEVKLIQEGLNKFSKILVLRGPKDYIYLKIPSKMPKKMQEKFGVKTYEELKDRILAVSLDEKGNIIALDTPTTDFRRKNLSVSIDEFLGIKRTRTHDIMKNAEEKPTQTTQDLDNMFQGKRLPKMKDVDWTTPENQKELAKLAKKQKEIQKRGKPNGKTPPTYITI